MVHSKDWARVLECQTRADYYMTQDRTRLASDSAGLEYVRMVVLGYIYGTGLGLGLGLG